MATDLSKAFDCLPHELILEKLEFYGLNDQAILLLRSYLSSRYQRVKLGDTYSTWMDVAAGVPQGSILGPQLFNIFMNVVYAIKDCRLIGYADDTKIYASHKDPQVVENRLNRELANSGRWFQENGMIQNPDKHQALVLGNINHETKLICANKSIPIANEMKLLALTLDNKLKFDSHVATISRKVGGQVNALNRLKNILPCRTKETLYRAFILLHFTYCSQIWHHYGPRNTRKIERVNERALRYVYQDRETSYEKLLEWIGLGCTLENRRIQDMLVTINNCFMGKPSHSIVNLIRNRNTGNILSLPKVNTKRHGLTSFKYFAAKQWNMLPDNIRSKAGTKQFIGCIRKVNF